MVAGTVSLACCQGRFKRSPPSFHALFVFHVCGALIVGVWSDRVVSSSRAVPMAREPGWFSSWSSPGVPPSSISMACSIKSLVGLGSDIGSSSAGGVAGKVCPQSWASLHCGRARLQGLCLVDADLHRLHIVARFHRGTFVPAASCVVWCVELACAPACHVCSGRGS